MSFVDDWEKAERIRNYLAALQAKLDAKGIAPSNPDKFAEWTEWARWYADFLCPITPTPLRQQSIEVPDNMPIAELDLTQSCRESLLAAPITDTNELYELTRKQIDELGKYGLWNEVNLVLEGLGYDVRGRSRW